MVKPPGGPSIIFEENPNNLSREQLYKDAKKGTNTDFKIYCGSRVYHFHKWLLYERWGLLKPTIIAGKDHFCFSDDSVLSADYVAADTRRILYTGSAAIHTLDLAFNLTRAAEVLEWKEMLAGMEKRLIHEFTTNKTHRKVAEFAREQGLKKLVAHCIKFANGDTSSSDDDSDSDF